MHALCYMTSSLFVSDHRLPAIVGLLTKIERSKCVLDPRLYLAGQRSKRTCPVTHDARSFNNDFTSNVTNPRRDVYTIRKDLRTVCSRWVGDYGITVRGVNSIVTFDVTPSPRFDDLSRMEDLSCCTVTA